MAKEFKVKFEREYEGMTRKQVQEAREKEEEKKKEGKGKEGIKKDLRKGKPEITGKEIYEKMVPGGIKKEEKKKETEEELGKGYVEEMKEREREREESMEKVGEEKVKEEERAKKELEDVEKERLKRDLAEAVDESVTNFIQSQLEIEKRDAELEEIKGKWLKKTQRQRLEAAKEIAGKSAMRSFNNIDGIKYEYLDLGLEEKEIKEIVQESFRSKGYSEEGIQEISGKLFTKEAEERRKGRGEEKELPLEEIEGKVTKEERKEAEKRSETVEEELKRLEKQADEEMIEVRSKNKKEALKYLVKNPQFWKIVIGGAVVGAAIACPVFGIAYGSLGLMSVKTAGVAWSVGGIAYGAATTKNLVELMRNWKLAARIRGLREKRKEVKE